MKTIFSIIVITLLFTVSAYAEAPAEFSDLDKKDFSFETLKYYKAKELVEGYCECQKMWLFHMHASGDKKNEGLRLQAEGQDNARVRKLEMEAREHEKRKDTANKNASRIERVLEKEYKYKGKPKCGGKSWD